MTSGGVTEIATVNVTINSVNDAPTSTNINGDVATWTEGGAAALLDVGSNATIDDIDSMNFNGGTLTVTISVGAFPAEEGLFIETVGGITSNPLTASTGTVSFMGTEFASYAGGGFAGGNITFTFDIDATPDAVEALVRAMSYNNNGGDNPTAGTRLVSWTLVDGDGVANAGADTLIFGTAVDVIVTNDNPLINDLGGDSATYTEEGPAVFLDSSVAATVTDADSPNFATGTLTVSITANEVAAEDVLAISTAGTVSLSAGMTVGSIVSVGGNAIGSITSTGAGGADLVVTFDAGATPARVSTLVQALTYANTNTTTPSELARTISVAVSDGDGGSDSETVTVNVVGTPENQPPTLDLDGDDSNTVGTGYAAAFTEGGAAVLITDADVAIADADAGDMIEGATITINSAVTGDQLVLGAQGGFVITGSGTATITITGTGTAAQYEAMLEQITFTTSSDDPGASRTVTTTVTDGDANSNAAVTTITITEINDEPTLTATGGTPTFTEGGAAADLFSAVSASTIEAGQSFTSLTLTVSNVTDGADEILNIDGSAVALTNGNSVVTTTAMWASPSLGTRDRDLHRAPA